MEIINRNQKFHSTINWGFFLRSRLYSVIFLSLGVIFIFTQFLLPFFLIETQSDFKAPVENSVLGAATGFQEVEFEELSNFSNETKKPIEERDYEIPKNFFIQIPKLKISNGKIETNSFNMNPEDFIGHYAGSSLPGEIGNVFIYGHSVLPFFFNEKNYKTIFSTLHELKENDEIIIRYNGKKYTYQVFEQKILKPNEVNPLEKVVEGSQTITLMTCTPPGTTYKRLLVNAVLKEVD